MNPICKQRITEAITAPAGTRIKVESQHSGSWGPWYHAAEYVKTPEGKFRHVPHSKGGHGRRDPQTPTIAEIREAAKQDTAVVHPPHTYEGRHSA